MTTKSWSWIEQDGKMYPAKLTVTYTGPPREGKMPDLNKPYRVASKGEQMTEEEARAELEGVQTWKVEISKHKPIVWSVGDRVMIQRPGRAYRIARTVQRVDESGEGYVHLWSGEWLSCTGARATRLVPDAETVGSADRTIYSALLVMAICSLVYLLSLGIACNSARGAQPPRARIMVIPNDPTHVMVWSHLHAPIGRMSYAEAAMFYDPTLRIPEYDYFPFNDDLYGPAPDIFGNPGEAAHQRALHEYLWGARRMPVILTRGTTIDNVPEEHHE